jgi:undecaprenyl-diphosphatase
MLEMIDFGYVRSVLLKEFIADIGSLGSLAFYLFIIAAAGLAGETGLSLRLIESLALIFIVVYAIKLFYAKPRPDFRQAQNLQKMLKRKPLLHRLNDASFPSLHSARISALSFSIYSAFPKILLLCLLMMALVSYSRIYLKRHYLSDVIGGIAIGLFAGYYVSMVL